MVNELSSESSESQHVDEPQLAAGDAAFTDEDSSPDRSKHQAASTDSEHRQDELADERMLVSKILLDIDAGSANKCSVNVGDADIDIQVNSSNRILVTATTLQGVDLASFDVAKRSRSLSFSFLPASRLRKVLRASNDKVRLTVHLPERLGVVASSTTGSIAVVGVKGPVTLSSTSGSLSVKDLTGPVKAETESGNIFGICYSSSVQLATKNGNIEVGGLAGGLVCNTKTGAAHLTWSDVPDDAKVVVHTGAGPATLYFPPTAKLNYRFITGANAIMNEFEQCDASNFLVRMISRRGSLFLKKAVSS